MDLSLLNNLALGFSVALTPINLLYCLVGVLLGTLIGVLPGIGPVATIAMLLPVTFSLSPITALIMLAGIYYGAQYGGSTSAILVNLPGESSSVVTCLDGYQMATRWLDRAGPELPWQPRPLAPSSLVAWRPSWWRCSLRRLPKLPSSSARRNISL